MPFRSEAQRRFMYARHPDIAKRWEDEAEKKGNVSAAHQALNRGKKAKKKQGT